MTTKRFMPSRIYKETDDKIKNIINELSYIERKRVSKPEVIRRVFNIPTLNDYLKIDSIRYKRRSKSLL